MKSILLVDSEVELSIEIQKKLQRAGFQVAVVQDCESAQDLAEQTRIDLFIVELNVNEDSKGGSPNPAYGTGLIRHLRAAGISAPILIHSTMSGEFHIAAALDAGADDYLVKRGESFRVLLARIQAHLRRDDRLLGNQSPKTRWVAANQFKVDRQERLLLVGSITVELTVQQTKLMTALVSSPSKIFSSDELLTIAWGHDVRREISALDMLLYRLRQKFEQAGVHDLIENVRGQGYRLAVVSVTPDT